MDTTSSKNDIDIKGKKVMTSPSLEDLNNKAEESWGESSSPKSSSSSSTITPDNFIKQSEDLINRSWEMFLPSKTKKAIKYIEKFFNSDDEVNLENSEELIQSLVEVKYSYDLQLELYETSNWTQSDKLLMKQGLFKYKSWISKYYSLIMPTEEIIELGNINDEPTNLNFK